MAEMKHASKRAVEILATGRTIAEYGAFACNEEGSKEKGKDCPFQEDEACSIKGVPVRDRFWNRIWDGPQLTEEHVAQALNAVDCPECRVQLDCALMGQVLDIKRGTIDGKPIK